MNADTIVMLSKQYKHEAENMQESISHLDRNSQLKIMRRLIYKCESLIRVCDCELSKFNK